MKKTFKLEHPKIKIDRLFETTRFEVKKYIKRERGKVLPEGADFWDFDCRFGDTELEAMVIHLGDIGKHIGDVQKRGLNSFYLEILAKPASRTKKPKEAKVAQDETSEDETTQNEIAQNQTMQEETPQEVASQEAVIKQEVAKKKITKKKVIKKEAVKKKAVKEQVDQEKATRARRKAENYDF